MRPYVTVQHVGTVERRMNRIVFVPGIYRITCTRRPISSANIFIHNVQYLSILMSSQNSRDFPVSLLMINPEK